MKNLRLLAIGLALVLVSAGSLALRTGTASASVTEMAASQYCFGNKLDVDFAWLATTVESTTYIDLSLIDNGWRPATFASAGPFGAGTATYKWSGVEPGRWHYVRVNQQLANGNWSPSATFSFFANGCGAVAAVVPPPAASQPVATISLIKCDDGTKSEILGSATCADHGGISARVTQPQVYTPRGGFPGNDIPVGQTGPYVPYSGAPGTTTSSTPGFTVCANGTISTNCTSAGGAATTSSSTTSTLGAS